MNGSWRIKIEDIENMGGILALFVAFYVFLGISGHEADQPLKDCGECAN
jgi:hypothetical protein